MPFSVRVALMASPTTLGVTAGSVALAPMHAALGLAATDASVLVAFTVGVAVGTPVGGRLERVYGGRAALWTAAGAIMLGATLTLAGQANAVVLAGRILLGLGSGTLTTLAFVAAGRHARPTTAFATISAVMNGLAGAGALVGAAVTAGTGWRVTLALPAIAVLAVPSALRAESRRPPSVDRIRLDRVGVALVAITVVTAVMALDGPSARLSSSASLTLAAVAVVGGALLTWWSRRSGSNGFVPVRAFRDANFRRALATGPSFMAANFSTLFLVPLLLTRDGESAFHVGLVALPATAVAVISGIAAARAHRAGWAGRLIALSGLTVLFVLSGAALTHDHLLYGAAVAAVLGATALSQGVLTATGTRTQLPEDRSGALGILNLTLQAGGAAGVALVALVVARSAEGALLLSGAFGLVGAGLGFTLIRQTRPVAQGRTSGDTRGAGADVVRHPQPEPTVDGLANPHPTTRHTEERLL